MYIQYIYIYIYVLYITCFRGLYALYKPANSDDITLGQRPRVISYLVAGLYNAYRQMKHVISDIF